jgi:poly(3-hydroxybutyrate) depolymerase
MTRQSWPRVTPWMALLAAVACGGPSSTGAVSINRGGSGSNGESGGAGTSSGDVNPGGANAGSSGASGGTGAQESASAGAESGASAGGSGASAAAGAIASSSGATFSGAGGGGATGSSGSSTSGGAAASDGGFTNDASPPMTQLPSGGSTGCGLAPVGATHTTFTDHAIAIPTCPGACNPDGGLPAQGSPSYPDCIDPCFAAGGVAYKNSGAYDYNHRDYTIELPPNYDPSTPYPIFFGGGGCGGPPPQGGAGFDGGETNAIKIGLSYINGCAADGGTYCSGSVQYEPLCVRGPELPYFRAVLADVESTFCIDRARVFVGGFSSGGWESFTLGCGGANLIRGIVTDEGGWRIHQPACTGPVAALMVAGDADTTNPIGPLMPCPPGDTSLDSCGSAPGRDAILQRNGCAGTATAPYDANYPACVAYTGCPKAFPVVWCPLPGAGHNDSSYDGVNYSPGSVENDPLMWSFLSKLPALQ